MCFHRRVPLKHQARAKSATCECTLSRDAHVYGATQQRSTRDLLRQAHRRAPLSATPDFRITAGGASPERDLNPARERQPMTEPSTDQVEQDLKNERRIKWATVLATTLDAASRIADLIARR